MINSKNRLFCRLDGLTCDVREQRRTDASRSLGLLEAETVPIFDEATQTAARFIEAPICILGLMVQDEQWFKAAVGLSNLGFMNQLATRRKISRQDSFCTYVVDSQQVLAIDDTLVNPVFANSALVQHYGIRAYLGTPLIASKGECIGTLAVMDLEPRLFSSKDAEFLALTARWCLREFERDRLLQSTQTQDRLLRRQLDPSTAADRDRNTDTKFENWDARSEEFHLSKEEGGSGTEYPAASPLKANNGNYKVLSSRGTDNSDSSPSSVNTTSKVKTKLLEQLAEKLRTPLTSVMGMASVLQREVYGSLTDKQKEYIGIIHGSGQKMLSLVEEIVSLGVSKNASELELSLVDVEMLCQQAINSLTQLAKQERQELRLSVEPGNRLWMLDKEKIRQALYYLALSIMEASEEGAQLRLHVSCKSKTLNIAVWVFHPWLGNGLPQVQLFSGKLDHLFSLEEQSSIAVSTLVSAAPDSRIITSSSLAAVLNSAEPQNGKNVDDNSRQILGLLLSCQLVELHGGIVTIQGLPESGCRYVVQIPEIAAE